MTESMQRDRFQKIAKRIIDLVGAFVLAVCFLPLTVMAAALIKIEDGGPVIHRRRVLGLKGPFDAYKLRTMRVDADQVLARDPRLLAEFEKSFKLRQDPRITKVGAFLRRSSLDEVPQLLNVLRGQMSLVGPRMITAKELVKYGDQGSLLLSVKPGLTGYWQINGRQQTEYDSRVRMDLHYIRNWSLWMDIVILLRTPAKVLKREGAY